MNWIAAYIIGALITGGYMAAHCAKHGDACEGSGLKITATVVALWPVFVFPHVGMEVYERHTAAADARAAATGEDASE